MWHLLYIIIYPSTKRKDYSMSKILKRISKKSLDAKLKDY